MTDIKKKPINDNGIILDIVAELARARAKFPNTKHVLAALTEETGELAQAFLHHEYENKGGHGNIYAEGIQVAAMAIRAIGEGDSTFPSYNPSLGYASAQDYRNSGACNWSYDRDKGYYVTGCDKEFRTQGTLRENGIEFCNFCGKKTVEKRR